MKRCQSLGSTDRFGNDSGAQLALDRILHDEIDWSAEDRIQPALDPEEVEESNSSFSCAARLCPLAGKTDSRREGDARGRRRAIASGRRIG